MKGWDGKGPLSSWGAQHDCPPGLSLLCGPVWLPPDLGSMRTQHENHDSRGAGPSTGAEVTHCLAYSQALAQPHRQAPVRGGPTCQVAADNRGSFSWRLGSQHSWGTEAEGLSLGHKEG